MTRTNEQILRSPSHKHTYSVDEAAALLGVSRSTLYECVKFGEIPAIRLRSRIVISATVIDAILSGAEA